MKGRHIPGDTPAAGAAAAGAAAAEVIKESSSKMHLLAATAVPGSHVHIHHTRYT